MLVTGLAFLTLHLHYSVRPVLFTYLFMALVVEVWTRRLQPLRRDWILLPIVFVAWANIHAGWAAALIFLSGAVAGRLIDRFRKSVAGEDAPVIPWIALIAVCTLATSINPWGWDLHRHVYLLATAYKSFALWNEYAKPNFSELGMSAITILCVVFVVFAARTSRRAPPWRWEALLPVLFFLYEGLKAQRHVLLLMEVVAVPLGRDLEIILHGTWLPYIRDRLPAIPGAAASRLRRCVALPSHRARDDGALRAHADLPHHRGRPERHGRSFSRSSRIIPTASTGRWSRPGTPARCSGICGPISA